MIEPKEPKMETNYIWNATFDSASETNLETFIKEHKEDLMKLNDFVFNLNCDNVVSAEKVNRISIRIFRKASSIDSCKEIAEKVKQYIKDNVPYLRISYQYLGESTTYVYEDEISAVENSAEERNKMNNGSDKNKDING